MTRLYIKLQDIGTIGVSVFVWQGLDWATCQLGHVLRIILGEGLGALLLVLLTVWQKSHVCDIDLKQMLECTICVLGSVWKLLLLFAGAA